MGFPLILYKTRNDLNMLSSRYKEKSGIFLGKEIYWSEIYCKYS